MGHICILNCIILCFGVLSVRCQFSITQDVQNRITAESLTLILKFLNDDVGASINYDSGKIEHTRLKGDILEVDITASVTCKSPSQQCNSESADCRGLLFIKPNEQLQVLSVDCKPNLPIEEPIALPIQDAHCEGCWIDINPNAKGVEQLAQNVIQHIESEKGKEYSLMKIIKVEQEVTNGVNFILTVLIGRPPGCNISTLECYDDFREVMCCAVKFFQEPGYQAPKNIISNNCTQTQTYIPVMPDYQSNDINRVDTEKDEYEGKYFYPKKTELSENDILKEINSQIIPSDEFQSESTRNEEMPTLVKNMETSSANNLLDESSQSIIASSTFQEILATEDEPISVGTDTATNQDETENVSSISKDATTRGSLTVNLSQQMVLPQLDSNIEVSSQSSELKEKVNSTADDNLEKYKRERRSLLGGKNEMCVDDPKIKEYAVKGIDLLNTKLNKGDSPFRISKIISATSQVVSGVSYDIKAQVIDCPNPIENCGNVPLICDINIWYRPWLDSRIITVKFGGETFSVDELRKNGRSKRESLTGGWRDRVTDDPKVIEHLGTLLSNLDSQSGMNNKLKIKKILSVSTQVVAGTNWRVKALVSRSDCEKSNEKNPADCGEDKNSFETECTFKFWEKLPDVNRLRQLDNVEIECDNPKLNYRSKRDIHVRKPRQVLIGGHNPLSNDDPRITMHLNHLLPQLDSQSDKDYKLKIKNVISATSQVVAGTNWNIKAKVLLSDCKRSDGKESQICGDNEKPYETVCEFKFWERLPDENGLRKLDNVKIDCQDSELTLRSKRDQYSVSKTSVKPNVGHNRLLGYAAFEEFEKTHNKQYTSISERNHRFSIFLDNMQYVELLNQHEKGTAVYGPTKFADLTREEFSKGLGYRSDLKSENEIAFMQADTPNVVLPDSFDWRDKNVVSGVKNQGSCGSCWAFSVTGNVEGQYAIKNGKLLEFSEQELVDCDTMDQGCNGGLMDNAYRQIEKIGGLEEEHDYPYDARNEKCHFNRTLIRVQLAGAVNISQDENEMAKWLVKNGPISIAINANAMQFYMGGVSHPWKVLCNPNSLDHGVLIVGYGVHTYPKFKKALPYWIVKNSWGTSWGEQGYYRVYKGDGTCGVNKTPSSAILK